MPFINGRYYINPTVGAAIEAARTAEEAMRSHNSASPPEPGRGSSADRDADPWGEGDEPTPAADERGPVHRVEIEAAEVVPGSTGRATRGFVARVHRRAAIAASAAPDAGDGRHAGANSVALRPETHAFTDHRDLLDFLAGELSKEHGSR